MSVYTCVCCSGFHIFDANTSNYHSVWNVEHCPTIRFRGGGCDADFHTILFNQKEIVWDPDAMNAFEYEIPIDANMGENTTFAIFTISFNFCF